MDRALLILAVALAVASCSTTRALPEGQSRLASSKVVIEGSDKDLKQGEITPYIRQKAGSGFFANLNPMLMVYNWSDGSDRFFSRLWRRIGTPPVVFSPASVDESCRNIEDHLEHIGYYGSSVSATVVTENRKTRVEYRVVPGTRYEISEIEYRLPGAPVFKEEFRADVPNSLVRPGAWLSEKLLEDESERGSAYFRNLGYYDLNKKQYYFEADTLSSSGKARLVYSIDDQGIYKYRIGKVQLSYPDNLEFKTRLLKDLNTLHSGDLYSTDAVSTTYNRLSSIRTFSSIGIELSPRDSQFVDCRIRLNQTELKGFKVNLEASTNSNGLIGVSPQLNFYHKNIFKGGEWLNLGFSGNFQFMLDNNVRSEEFGVTAGLSFPRFLGVPSSRFTGQYIPRTDINVSFTHNNRYEYKRNMLMLSYGYSGIEGNRNIMYQFYPIRLNVVDMRDMGEDFLYYMIMNPMLYSTYSDHFDAGISAMIYHTSDPDVVPKSSYNTERFTLDLSGNLLALTGLESVFGLPYSQYVKAQLELAKAFRWGRNNGHAIVGHLVAGAGHAYGQSLSMPFEKLFYAGGAYGMRGWQSRTLGPGSSGMMDFFSIPSQVGDFKLEFDLEYRFNMFWKLEGALFAEVGNVYELSDLNIADIAADWGFGVRVDLSFLLLRLDVGFKTLDPSREPGDRWIGPRDWLKRGGYSFHFGVGYPF